MPSPRSVGNRDQKRISRAKGKAKSHQRSRAEKEKKQLGVWDGRIKRG